MCVCVCVVCVLARCYKKFVVAHTTPQTHTHNTTQHTLSRATHARTHNTVVDLLFWLKFLQMRRQSSTDFCSTKFPLPSTLTHTHTHTGTPHTLPFTCTHTVYIHTRHTQYTHDMNMHIYIHTYIYIPYITPHTHTTTRKRAYMCARGYVCRYKNMCNTYRYVHTLPRGCI